MQHLEYKDAFSIVYVLESDNDSLLLPEGFSVEFLSISDDTL